MNNGWRWGMRIRTHRGVVTYLENFIVPRRQSGFDRPLFPGAKANTATLNAGVFA